MRALRIDDKTITLDPRAAEPQPGPGEALIRPVRAGVAPADLAVASGRTGFRGVLGHEFVGVVERLPSAADKADLKRWVGRRVVGSIDIVCGRCELCRAGLSSHCRDRAVLGMHRRDGCFADRFTLPLRNLFEVPDGVDDEAAVLALPLGAAIHAAHLTRIEGKPYVTVLGDGPEALLAAQVMARMNASVRLLGERAAALRLCEKWGIKHRRPEEVGRRQDQDVVVGATGARSGLELAMRLVRPRGKIVLMNAAAPPVPDAAPAPEPGAGPEAAPPAADLTPLVMNEVELIGARCTRLPDALAMLSRAEVEVAGIITRRMRLDDGAAALRAAAGAEQIKVSIEV